MSTLKKLLAFLAIGAMGVSAPAQSGQTGADLRVEHGDYYDPPATGYYSYYIYNDSGTSASNVRLECDLPEGSLFRNIFIDANGTSQSPVCESPASDQRGSLVVRLGTVDPSAFISVQIFLRYDGEAGTDVSMPMRVVSDTPDPNPDNNSYTYDNLIPYPPIAPTITKVRSRNDPGLGFVVTIEGTNLVGPFNHVGIGCDCDLWPQVASWTETRIVLSGGSELRSKFPKGIPVRICVIVPGGVPGYAMFTRR